jgi:hypothetical protein
MSLPERWFRTNPDSSILDRPRLLARSLISVTELDDRVAFYERLLGVPADLRMPIPDFGGLELAAVGNLLLIASARQFTPIQQQTAYSLIVPSLTSQLEMLERAGVTVLESPEVIMPGSRARVRYPDGVIAELVEHRPQPGEQAASRSGIATNGPHLTGMRLLARQAVPRAGLDDAVKFYESALETETEVRIEQRTPAAYELAIVGNLLLVGSDELSCGDGARVAFALLAPCHGTVGSAEDGRTVVTLAGGVLAEVWDKQVLQS